MSGRDRTEQLLFSLCAAQYYPARPERILNHVLHFPLYLFGHVLLLIIGESLIVQLASRHSELWLFILLEFFLQNLIAYLFQVKVVVERVSIQPSAQVMNFFDH
jgi:hypothetical protein